jgi:hypothetical protein
LLATFLFKFEEKVQKGSIVSVFEIFNILDDDDEEDEDDDGKWGREKMTVPGFFCERKRFYGGE